VHFWEQGLLELEGPGNEPDAEKEPGFDPRVRQRSEKSWNVDLLDSTDLYIVARVVLAGAKLTV
jgi:hypothetical protein